MKWKILKTWVIPTSEEWYKQIKIEIIDAYKPYLMLRAFYSETMFGHDIIVYFYKDNAEFYVNDTLIDTSSVFSYRKCINKNKSLFGEFLKVNLYRYYKKSFHVYKKKCVVLEGL